MQAPTALPVQPANHLRFRVFLDFWNVQLTLNEHESQTTGRPDSKFRIDWLKLPGCLIQEAVKIVRAISYSYHGTIIYTSYNPKIQDRGGQELPQVDQNMAGSAAGH